MAALISPNSDSNKLERYLIQQSSGHRVHPNATSVQVYQVAAEHQAYWSLNPHRLPLSCFALPSICSLLGKLEGRSTSHTSQPRGVLVWMLRGIKCNHWGPTVCVYWLWFRVHALFWCVSSGLQSSILSPLLVRQSKASYSCLLKLSFTICKMRVIMRSY